MAFRDVIAALAPPWLQRYMGSRWLYTRGLVQDAQQDRAQQGIDARYPLRCNASALPSLGSDRVIPRGPSETDTSYGRRLQGAFDLWQLAAGNAGVLQAVRGYLEGDWGSPGADYLPGGAIVTDGSRWTYTVLGAPLAVPPSFSDGAANWDWDGTSAWWRWWLILYWFTDAGSWGDPGRTWGQAGNAWGIGNAAPATFDTLRALIALCMRSGSWCRYICLDLSGYLMRPYLTADGTHNPDGTWGSAGKMSGTSYVRARPLYGRFVTGVPVQHSVKNW